MRDLAPEDRAYIETLAPPPAVITGIVALVFYIDEDGQQQLSQHIDVDLPTAAVVGTLQSVALDLLLRTRDES